MKKILIAIVAGVVAFAGLAFGESKLATGTTSAAITFGANPDQPNTLKALTVKSDLSSAVTKIYQRIARAPVTVTSAPANNATNVLVSNTSLLITTNDIVVYAYTDGTLAVRTVVTASATAFTFSGGLPQAGAATDKVYELEECYRIANGSTFTHIDGDALITTRRDSPLYILSDGTSAIVLSATAVR